MHPEPFPTGRVAAGLLSREGTGEVPEGRRTVARLRDGGGVQEAGGFVVA